MLVRPVFAMLLLISFVSESRAQASSSTDPGFSITELELREHIQFLAADSLEGRYTGSNGYQIAARYAAEQFRLGGVQPVLEEAGGGDPFLQAVPFQRVLDQGSLVIRTPDGEIELRGGEDFKYLICLPRRIPREPLPLVFTGFGIEEPDAGWNDYDGLDIAGTAAIILPGSPSRSGEPVFSEELHRLYSGGDGDGPRFWALRNRRPAVFLLRTNTWREANWDRLNNDMRRCRLMYDGDGPAERQGWSNSRGFTNQIVVREEALNRIFVGQEYSPARIREEGIEGYRTFRLRDAVLEFRFEFQERVHDSWNVVGMVPGTDPVLRNEYVVVGAHLDHIAPSGGQINNGADDNASGSAGVLEIAEAVAMAPPRRSVIFVLYTAEEMGLIGSEHFLNHSPVPVDKMVANLNLDMIGRTAPEHANNRAHYVISPGDGSDALSALIREVNETTVRWPLVFRPQEGLVGGSDHQSFLARGIPAVFFFSGSHADLHRPTDDAHRIEYDKAQRISRLVYEVVMELGNRPEPLQRVADTLSGENARN